MSTIRNRIATLRSTLLPIAAAAAILGWVAPASAYLLSEPGNCPPGDQWDLSRPVKVQVLDDSVSDYAQLRGASASDVRARMSRDIDAVIKLYNSISGSRLVLDRGSSITGDKDLQGTGNDNFGEQAIVIGFTNERFGPKDAKTNAEAETDRDTAKCTIKRVHIRFRKNDDPNNRPFVWVFGPPDDYTCNGDCRSFSTKDQPQPAGNKSERTFLGILTHEMGHAVGLEHPDDNYAVMAQNSRTWFRGQNEDLHTQLLPDDISAVLALYGGSNDRGALDISATNTWYESDAAQFATTCATQMAAVKKASEALADATGSSNARLVSTDPSGSGSQGSNQDTTNQLLQALTDASNALQACKDSQNAMQIKHCLVSSRADDWVDLVVRSGGAVVTGLCGVNKSPSTFPAVSNRICPGKQVQLRYTLNNHTKLREVLVKTEVWFSSDMALNTTDGSDVQSPDIREFTLPAASSAPIGQVFRSPAKVPSDGNGQTYVFVRAIPYDPNTNASLLNTEADQFNNATMIPDVMKVEAAGCS